MILLLLERQSTLAYKNRIIDIIYTSDPAIRSNKFLLTIFRSLRTTQIYFYTRETREREKKLQIHIIDLGQLHQKGTKSVRYIIKTDNFLLPSAKDTNRNLKFHYICSFYNSFFNKRFM